MNKLILLILCLLVSCSVKKSVPVSHKTSEELLEFYERNNVSDFFILDSYKSLVELYKQDRVSIPKNMIFDSDGFEIKHFNEKLCVNHTLEFLKNYDQNTKINKSYFTINEFLKHFKSVNSNLDIEEILNSKKIRVFVNSATYADKYKANEEAFEIYKLFRDKFEVYVINLDYIDAWEDK